ncbi:Leucine rich repeat variant [uncultured Caudovirales phage]|uniref:Leucine rich repeat variant n=1 Tax=uncultured Caudovirales phage TaxID=2100421 RepID=A0A6J5NQI3_9CAUD|nr:Leucine rich repeat variant [uncultured Caudovirales phage]
MKHIKSHRVFESEEIDLSSLKLSERRVLANSGKTSPSVLSQLSSDRDERVRMAVASNSNTPTEDLTRLFKNEPNSSFVHIVAANPSVDPSILVRIANHPDFSKGDGWTLSSIAKNPACPVDLLEQLAGHPIFRVRSGVASNPNTPHHVLRQLAGDQHYDVVLSLSTNPELTGTVLMDLAGHEYLEIRRNVALHNNTPTTVLFGLAQDEARHVRESAKSSLRNRDVTGDLFDEAGW